MKRRPILVAFLIVISLTLPAAGSTSPTPTQPCSFPLTQTDATGTEITVEQEPKRVVTLNPSAAQIMWEIGAREKVVGLTKYASYLEGSDNHPVVSSESDMVVFEKVVDLDPDIVLAPNATSSSTVEKLREAGLTVYHFPLEEDIDDVYDKTQTIGQLTGECEGANETVDWMQDRLGVVREAVRGQDRPDVLYVFFGYTAGTGTFINEIIRTAGGNNIAADAGIESYKQISAEVVVEQNPDWIILNSNDPALPESEAYNQTAAVQEGQVVVVKIEHLNQPAPRIVYAITKLTEHFHPEAYTTANRSTASTVTPTPQSTPTPTSASTPQATATPTGTPGQPGFGFVLTLYALGTLLGVGCWRRV